MNIGFPIKANGRATVAQIAGNQGKQRHASQNTVHLFYASSCIPACQSVMLTNIHY